MDQTTDKEGIAALSRACAALGGIHPHWVLCRTSGNRKAPVRKDWQKTAAPLEAALTHPGLVGIIPLSLGCVVVDIDEGGLDCARAIESALGPALASIPTPSGGRHLWYRAGPEQPQGNARWAIEEGSGDLRAGKGHVVLWDPHSLAEHMEEAYADTFPLVVSLPKPARASPGQPREAPANIPRSPAKPREAPAKPARSRALPRDPAGDREASEGWQGLADPYIATAVEAELAEIAHVGAGGRNEALNKAAFSLGQLCAAGPDGNRVLALLRDAALAAGLPRDEADATIASGWEAGAKSPRERPRAPARSRAIPRAGSAQPSPAQASLAKPREAPRLVEPDEVDPTQAPDKHAPGLEHALEQLGIELRLDIRSGRTEFRRPEAHWAVLTDTEAAALRQEIADGFWYRRSDRKRARLRYGVEAWQEASLALLNSRRVDPFAEWLSLLPPVDGDMGLLDRWLAELFQVPNPTPLHAWAGRYVFLGAIQRSLDPGCQLDEVPVLMGAQGIGKSSVLRAIFPEEPPGWQDRYYSGRLQLDDEPKRQLEALLGRVLVELAELTGIRDRRRVEAVKAFITLRDDGDIRLSYARNPEPRPRRCIFVGTSNPRPAGVLPNDPTGNRRWVVVNLNAPEGRVEDWMAQHRDRLWREAMERYMAGERANLPRELAGLAEAEAEAQRWRDPIEDDLEAALAARFNTGLLTYSELGQLLGNDKLGNDYRLKARFAEALFARGWYRDRSHAGRGFMPPGGLGL